ncbi:retrovirus-related pol polyprotein from transposon TNT 1-94 [Tanacetum coccineum]
MPRSPDWYVDSGATAHMAPSSTTLDSSVPYHGREKVCFGNGNVLPSRIGTLSVNRNLKLQVVLSVPNITKKLLSDSATKAILATGTHKDGLYVLKTRFKALTSSIASPNKASFELWHKRLGHVAFDVISSLNKCGLLHLTSILPTPSIFSSCELLKQHRLPFQLNDKRSL